MLADALARQFRTEEAIELYWRAFDKAPDLDGKLGIVAKLTSLYLQRSQFDRLVARLERESREASQPVVGVNPDPPVHLMNRHQRRAHMRTLGHTWGSARRLSKRMDEEAAREKEIAAKASKLTPEEARKALAEWAARGGK